MAARVLTPARFVVLALATASCWLVASFDDLGPKDAGGDAMDELLPGDASCDAGSNDPNNCGACGHSCQGGACDGGVCQPILLASGQSIPSAIAVDDTYVYWSDYRATDGGLGQIWVVTKDGGTPVLLHDNEPEPGPLLPIGPQLYWLRQGSFDGGAQAVWVSGIDGGGGKQFASAGMPIRLAYDGTYLYWADFKSGIWRQPIAFAGSACSMVYYPTAAGVGVAPAGDIFWSAEGNVEAGIAGGIFNTTGLCSNLDGAVPFEPRPNGNPFDLALDDASVYWSEINNASGNAINSIPRGGGVAVQLYNNLSGRYEIAVDHGWIYWAGKDNVGKGAVFGEHTDGTGLVRYYTSPYDPSSIAVDACCIYFTDPGPSPTVAGGQVFKVAR